jgi:uncharacterized C2H2 Zn-finger protein
MGAMPTRGPESGSTGGSGDEAIFGRCPTCGFITEEAYDYDYAGNELFKCARRLCGAIFAQDKHGGYVVFVDGLPLSGPDGGAAPILRVVR